MTRDFKTKPDPDEPWRFVCPECGCQVFKGNSPHLYWCNTCRVYREKSNLTDQKTGEQTTFW